MARLGGEGARCSNPFIIFGDFFPRTAEKNSADPGGKILTNVMSIYEIHDFLFLPVFGVKPPRI